MVDNPIYTETCEFSFSSVTNIASAASNGPEYSSIGPDYAAVDPAVIARKKSLREGKDHDQALDDKSASPIYSEPASKQTLYNHAAL